MNDFKAIRDLENTFGYIDALKDLGFMPDEQHTQAVRDLHNVRALIYQALERHECLAKGKK
jgi:hypothetical protein